MSRRRNPRRGTWTLLKPLLFVVVLAVIATALFTWWRSTRPESTELTVRYRTAAPAVTGVAKPWIEVINSSEKTVELEDVTVRYYFTAGDSAPYGSNCVQTSLGCSRVTQEIAAVDRPAPHADHYLQVGFAKGSGRLEPGGSTEAIGLQLYRLDRKELDQADDHSFDAAITSYAESKKLTAYLGGTRVWGDEPGGDAASGQHSRAAAPVAPSGVMFDDFHYSGSGDPALAANGWQVRTGEGGPGIRGSWSSSAVSFPALKGAGGEQGLQLQVSTDGTARGTRQAEVQNTKAGFFTGTVAARVHFTDSPDEGRDGDHINQSFFAISPDHTSPRYSELDFEYMPNGGWGAKGPRLDTTSWRTNEKKGDRVTHVTHERLAGWHTLAMTAVDGKVAYSLDGRTVFSTSQKYFPRERMGIHFSSWLVDLPFKGARNWKTQVDWMYYQDGRAVPVAEVEKQVTGLRKSGTPYVNTLPKS
ncbi:cellulose binding domain-containing protein [Streptomyces sp. NPDC001941]|uniref:cellulose binding domain-containing protein n=1 Tax=Streptomyces sp. NPDC001941 TaxID=3154659 RepID=UPI0033286502